MPTLSCYFLRGGLLYLATGMLLGGLILCQKGVGRFPVLWVLLPAHIYLVLIGGVSQCALGVIYWIFPRFKGGTSRGTTWLASVAYVALNVAIVLIILHPLIQGAFGRAVASLAFVLAGILQSLAALTFVVHIWPRIRASDVLPRRPHPTDTA